MVQNIIEAKNISLTYHIRSSVSMKKLFTRTINPGFNLKLTVEALKDVSFSLTQGQNLGIVGTNGSGKSTLLRVIANTFTPDQGVMNIYAKKTQLLTLGAGFIDTVSGRDNLYLNALLLGISKEELDNGLAEEIIIFSELGDAIEYPVYTYSSGMRSRLTFSVAACVQPELLLLDEVFSVGDAHFKAKSQHKIEEMINSDKSVVMISHDTNAIENHCDKALWLHKGEVKMYDEPNYVMKQYLEFTK